jgi:hypothetical protein
MTSRIAEGDLCRRPSTRASMQRTMRTLLSSQKMPLATALAHRSYWQPMTRPSPLAVHAERAATEPAPTRRTPKDVEDTSDSLSGQSTRSHSPVPDVATDAAPDPAPEVLAVPAPQAVPGEDVTVPASTVLERGPRPEFTTGSAEYADAARKDLQHSASESTGSHGAATLVNSLELPRLCSRKGCTESHHLRQCGRCLSASYCSKECQVQAWQGHKQDCRHKRGSK